MLERCWWSYLNWNPRLGEFLAIFTATAGKWLFCLVNPFVVLSLALMMFYLARGRRVRPGDWRDVLLFTVGGLLLLTSSSRPGITMFWLSGGTNYAWAATVWLGFLCLYHGLRREFLDSGQAFSWFWIGAAGFAAGMTNENQVPASLGMLFLFWLYARWNKAACLVAFLRMGRPCHRSEPAFCWRPAIRPACIRRLPAGRPFFSPGENASVPFLNC